MAGFDFNVLLNPRAKKGELNPCILGAGAHIAQAQEPPKVFDNPADPKSLAARLASGNVDNPNC